MVIFYFFIFSSKGRRKILARTLIRSSRRILSFYIIELYAHRCFLFVYYRIPNLMFHHVDSNHNNWKSNNCISNFNVKLISSIVYYWIAYLGEKNLVLLLPSSTGRFCQPLNSSRYASASSSSKAAASSRALVVPKPSLEIKSLRVIPSLTFS